MISFDRVSKRYPNGREALSNVTFNINTGEMVFLTGRSVTTLFAPRVLSELILMTVACSRELPQHGIFWLQK